MEVKLAKGPGQLNDPNFWLDLKLSKKQVKVLQDALSYAAWQFSEGGSDPQSSIDFLNKLHDKIEEVTGVTGDH